MVMTGRTGTYLAYLRVGALYVARWSLECSRHVTYLCTCVCVSFWRRSFTPTAEPRVVIGPVPRPDTFSSSLQKKALFVLTVYLLTEHRIWSSLSRK